MYYNFSKNQGKGTSFKKLLKFVFNLEGISLLKSWLLEEIIK